MDDETYVYLDTQLNLQTQFYLATEREDVALEEKTIPKFEKKVMVSQAICTCGKKSKIFYTVGTITADHQIMYQKAVGEVPRCRPCILARFSFEPLRQKDDQDVGAGHRNDPERIVPA